MAPAPRLTTPITSRRYLVLRHGRRLVRIQQEPEFAIAAKTQLDPGHEKLFASKVPGLKAGSYSISVDQDIVTDENDKNNRKSLPSPSTQQFKVLGPQFTLPSDALYSTYPPQGHTARPEVLPHVVFNDATFPWERTGSFDAEEHHPDDYEWNRVPWVACLPFTIEELKLQDNDLKGDQSLFKNIDSLKDGAVQAEDMSVQMAVSDVLNLNHDRVVSPFTAASIADATEKTAKLVFLKSKLFNNLFAKRNVDGTIQSTANPNVSQYRFLSHVQRVNTRGMAEADQHEDEQKDEREFGITVSHRTGPLKIQQPTTVAVHLLSIVGVEQMGGFPIRSDYVALISLYSWTYMCLPPNSFNLAETFETLAETRDLLRPSLPQKPMYLPPQPTVKERIMKRIEDGYSLVRHRLITGEETSAFMRGPLNPTVVQFPLWTELSSNSGSSLQILDQELGLMDITYAAAWQLGRTLAMADSTYSTAVSRVRKAVLTEALNKAQQQTLKQAGILFKERDSLLKSLGNSMVGLSALSAPSGDHNIQNWGMRWSNDAPKVPNLSYHSPEIVAFIEDELEKAAKKIASSSDGNDQEPYGPPYDEYNTPYSVDWVVVLRFVLDLMYLINVPAQYLLTDPSHLPEESLRLFYIDRNWIEALVDGALSIGNHIDPKVDKVRTAIKRAVNRYFETPNSTLNYPPPISRYGFLLRSAAVAQFPDLVVSTSPIIDQAKTPLLGRHEIVENKVMLGLLTHVPESGGLLKLTFTQPAHQQSFTCAKNISNSQVETSYKRIYTMEDPQDDNRNIPIEERTWNRGTVDNRGAVFIWGTDEGDDIRTVHVENMADDLHTRLTDDLNKLIPGAYTEQLPTAATMCLQLNGPCWQIQAELPNTMPSTGAMKLGYKLVNLVANKRAPRVRNKVQQRSFNIPSISDRQIAPAFVSKHLPPYFRPILDSSIFREETLDTDSGRSSPEILTPTSTGTPEMMLHISHSSSLSDLEHLDLSVWGAPPPQFIWKVTPASEPTSLYIPKRTYQQDLVISIVYDTEYNPAEYLLNRVQISIPIGQPEGVSTLMVGYQGPGCVMLSNLQFNPRTTYNGDTGNLDIVLLPRTMKGFVPVKRIRELSFLLRGVIVYPYTTLTGVKLIGLPTYVGTPPVADVPFYATIDPTKE